MEIKIFDVSHGSCAYVIADNRNVALLDCGYNAETGFRPSNYLMANRCTGIDLLQGVSRLQRTDPIDQQSSKLFVDGLVREDPLHADAALAGLVEGADDKSISRERQVRALIDDARRVAPQLQHHLFPARSRLECPSDVGRAGKAEQL